MNNIHKLQILVNTQIPKLINQEIKDIIQKIRNLKRNYGLDKLDKDSEI